MESTNKVELGDCFILKYKDKFVSIIVIKANHVEGNYAITPVINEFKEIPDINEFGKFDILAVSYWEKTIPDGWKGLFAIYLRHEELLELKKRFDYLGRIELDESLLEIKSGTLLQEDIPYEENFIPPIASREYDHLTRVKIENIIKK